MPPVPQQWKTLHPKLSAHASCSQVCTTGKVRVPRRQSLAVASPTSPFKGLQFANQRFLVLKVWGLPTNISIKGVWLTIIFFVWALPHLRLGFAACWPASPFIVWGLPVEINVFFGLRNCQTTFPLMVWVCYPMLYFFLLVLGFAVGCQHLHVFYRGLGFRCANFRLSLTFSTSVG